jgi:1,4-dihydroxy-2-naphthoate octaprenyltransferase
MSIKDWLLLSRSSFLIAVIAPYTLGALLACRVSGMFNWPVFLLGMAGALCVQLIAHFSGEVYDLAEDRLSVTLERNFFTGGSQVVVENKIQPVQVKNLIRVVFWAAVFLGLILQFYFKTGKFTFLLGASGIICAYFYARPPLRIISRGWGEFLIAYAFGWLAVNCGFYLQAGRFDRLSAWASLAVAFSVVNMILINEYPDYPADRLAAKKNILVRIGKEKGACLYAFLAISGAAVFLWGVAKGLPVLSAVFYLPVLIISLGLAYYMLKGAYCDRRKLEKMCGLTVLVNLGVSASYILGLLF